MRFRPCIDIHDGQVKQIVGGSLDDTKGADTNFVSEYDAAFFGRLYKNCGLKGGHIILLNKAGTPEYLEDIREAANAISEFRKGFMIGGGITPENAPDYITMGTSHVIVTSYVFSDGKIDMERLQKMKDSVGKEHLVLDLSCRKKEDGYYIVTDRWQKFTDTKLTLETMEALSDYADEYLIHAVDMEGKKAGVDAELIKMLGEFDKIPVTYAGGVSSMEDLELIRKLGQGRVDVTVGSALSIFGGDMDWKEVLSVCDKDN